MTDEEKTIMERLEQKLGVETAEVLRELIECILDESSDRKDYINNLFHVMKGALGEYLKARYAEANGDPAPDERQHWDTEVEEHFMFRFRDVVFHHDRGGKNHRNARDEALLLLRRAVPGELARSKYELCKAIKGLQPRHLVDPTDSEVDEFFARCMNEYDKYVELDG